MENLNGTFWCTTKSVHHQYLEKNLKFHQPAYRCLSFAKEIRDRCMQDKNCFNKVGNGTTEEVLKFISLHPQDTYKVNTKYSQNPLYGRSLMRTCHCYGQFALSLGKESPYMFSKFNPLNTDTPFRQMLCFCLY